jgi:hypothetical protein
MHHFGYGLHMLEGRLWQDAVAEVEDMARMVGGPL